MRDPHHINGLFVGQLSEEELAWFEQAVEDGRASRSYENGGGFVGLCKVRIH